MVNGEDIYNLVKEEVDYDPNKIETLNVNLKVNDKLVISKKITYIIEDVEDSIQTTLGMGNLSSLKISGLKSKSWVANEFLDMLCCYTHLEQGIDKLIL